MENYLTKRRIGFFGGTFDPLHHGHLNLAISLLEAHQLDQILFTPTNYSPAKETQPPHASKEARTQIVKRAIEEIPDCTLCDLEVKREGPSYTIETIQQLYERNGDVQYFLILGEDMVEGLPAWKDIEKLVELAPPLVGTRVQAEEISLPFFLKVVVEEGRTPISVMEISSTTLRERLKNNMYCGHLIPAKVLDFIESKSLY